VKQDKGELVEATHAILGVLFFEMIYNEDGKK